MSEETKVNRDYLEAFNLGYELAKELDLKTPMFKGVKSGSNRMSAVQAGMIQYSDEVKLPLNRKIDKSANKISTNPNQRFKDKSKNTGKGLTP